MTTTTKRLQIKITTVSDLRKTGREYEGGICG